MWHRDSLSRIRFSQVFLPWLTVAATGAGSLWSRCCDLSAIRFVSAWGSDAGEFHHVECILKDGGVQARSWHLVVA